MSGVKGGLESETGSVLKTGLSHRAVGFLIVLLIASLPRAVILFIVEPYRGNLPPVYPDLEPYQDFTALYLKDVEQFLKGKTPYTDFYHAWPPLFLYLLTSLSLVPLGFLFQVSVMVAFDALAVIPVYLIAKRITTSRWAFAIAVIFGLSPVTLWYDTALWLNPSPSNLLMLTSLSLYLSGRPRLSALSLGIAASFKQTAGVILPALILISWRNRGVKEGLTYLLLAAVPFLAASTPYLMTNPHLYIWSLGVPGIPTPSPYAPPKQEWKYDLSEPANIAMYLGIFGLTDLSLTVKSYLPIILAAAYAITLYQMAKIKRFTERDTVSYCLYVSLIFYALLPRGIYKYYFTAVLPLLAVLVFRVRHILFFVAFNVGLLYVPRFLSPWFSLLLIPIASFLQLGQEDKNKDMLQDNGKQSPEEST